MLDRAKDLALTAFCAVLLGVAMACEWAGLGLDWDESEAA